MAPCAERRKVWLTPSTLVSRSNATNIGERKTWMQSNKNSLTGQQPPPQKKTVYVCMYVCMHMYVRTLWSVPAQETAKHRAKLWLTSVERRRCSNEAKARNPLKFAWVPQTVKPMSAVSRPTFTILCGYVEILLHTRHSNSTQWSVHSRVHTCAQPHRRHHLHCAISWFC